MASAREQATADIAALGRAIDDLHHKLAAATDVDKDKLRQAVEKFKAAHRTFSDDAQGCMN